NTLPAGNLLNGVTNNTAQDGFLAKIDPGGVILDSSTYFGVTNNEAGFRIAIDGSGYVYFMGPTSPGNYPIASTNVLVLHAGTVGTNLQLNTDAYLTKVHYNGNTPSIVYSALFGGTNNDTGWAVAVDAANNAYVIGITVSSNFPALNTNGFLKGTSSGSNEGFVTAF